MEPCVDDCISIPSSDVELAASLDLPPGDGPHPVMVVVHGSGEIERDQFEGFARSWTALGVAVLRYDKRGVGQSTGSFRGVSAGNSDEVFDVLAGDVVAVVDYVAARPEIDADRIGLVGASQAGWIMPLAASSSAEVDFIVSISGATSSVGLSDRFDEIAESGMNDAEIAAELAAFDGEQGFDPRPALESLDIPVLWLYGGRDQSNPTANDIAVIEAIGSPRFTVELFPDGTHELVDADTGEPFDTFAPMRVWMVEIGVLD